MTLALAAVPVLAAIQGLAQGAPPCELDVDLANEDLARQLASTGHIELGGLVQLQFQINASTESDIDHQGAVEFALVEHLPAGLAQCVAPGIVTTGAPILGARVDGNLEDGIFFSFDADQGAGPYAAVVLVRNRHGHEVARTAFPIQLGGSDQVAPWPEILPTDGRTGSPPAVVVSFAEPVAYDAVQVFYTPPWHQRPAWLEQNPRPEEEQLDLVPWESRSTGEEVRHDLLPPHGLPVRTTFAWHGEPPCGGTLRLVARDAAGNTVERTGGTHCHSIPDYAAPPANWTDNQTAEPANETAERGDDGDPPRGDAAGDDVNESGLANATTQGVPNQAGGRPAAGQTAPGPGWWWPIGVLAALGARWRVTRAPG